jgi:D-3-phosphoglycerate dehydrogenase
VSEHYKVLVTCPQMQRTIDHFRDELDAAGVDPDLPEVVQALSESELLEIIDRYDGMIAGDDEVTANVIGAATRMKVISKWGVGVDGIDRAAAAAKGITITNTPGAFGDEVADVALGYVVMLARGLHKINSSVEAGGWDKPVGMTLRGKTLGVVGLGSIGLAVVERARSFGVEVLGFDPFESQHAPAKARGAEPVALDELLRRSRFVVLCCPLTPDNLHLISARTLALMGRDAFLVNVARGPLVSEADLASALADGTIAGAALDVFEVEPLPMDSPLRKFDSVIFGSHNGSNTEEGTLKVSRLAVKNLIANLQGVAG